MIPLRIFISSVQKELAEERAALGHYLNGDALLRRFFEVFLFEEMPAADRRADACYLEEVQRCDIYIGIFGNEYGWEDGDGLSPTHREFCHATKSGKTRLIYVKGSDDSKRHPKMKALISEVGAGLIRRRINSAEELIAAVYASLIKLLEERELIRFTPFDATFCRNATLEDLDFDRVSRFLVLARRGRNFPLAENTPPEEVLTHLNLLDKGRPTHAAVLLFAKKPQRFLITSEVKCAHFHGFDVEKPIPSYQVYKGTVFELIDQAKDFVLSKIDLWTGDRSQGTQVPTAYEIPQEVVAEAIVNAVCHRDYTSNASVQVMLFKDRLEIWNPGSMPPGLTLEKLKKPHHSVPANPLIAEPLYLTKHIERMGTGIRDMLRRCQEAGLPEPAIQLDTGEWVTTIWRKPRVEPATRQVTGEATDEVTGEVTGEVLTLLNVLKTAPMGRKEVQGLIGLKGQANFRERYLEPALSKDLIEMTQPESPKSPTQKYRLTAKGRELLKRSES
jgi:predicted HTH transcriptional regulator